MKKFETPPDSPPIIIIDPDDQPMCSLFQYGENQEEAVMLRTFHFSLCEEAKIWLNELNEGTFTSWNEIGIFLYNTPNEAFQILEDKVLFQLDFSGESQNSPEQKITISASGNNINSNHAILMEKFEALATKIDSEFMIIRKELREMRDGRRDNYASQIYMKDDTPMCEPHEANYGGSPAGIHGLFSERYYGLAGRMITLRVSTAGAKGVTTGTLVRLRRHINLYWEIFTGRPLGAYNLKVVTPRALVYAGLMTSGDDRSWCVLIKVNGWFWRLKMCTLGDLGFKTEVMSTPAYVDSATITQADGAQNSRPEEAPLEAEESQLLGSRVPLMGEEFEASKPSGTRTISSHYSASSDSTTPLSPDHPLIQASTHPVHLPAALSPSSFRKRYRSSYETPSPSSSLSLPIHKRQGLYDEGQGLEDEGPSVEEEMEDAHEGQQRAVPVVDTAASKPLGLRYGEARRRALESTKDIAPSTYKVGQSSRYMLEQEGAERIPPSPEWSLGSVPISPSSPVVPSPIASPLATPVATISVDEDQCLNALPPTLFEGYDRDLRELYTRSWAVRDKIFSQRYRFRSLEREQERAMVIFSVILRPVLALEACACQTDAQREALWHAVYDIQRENHDLRRQLAEERREHLELTDRVARMKRRQESEGE
ncbi:hypothetical protein Tco_0027497 [Tanacetum coccineum]